MSAPSVIETATHVPCCSAHRVDMTCERYRRTHFVEVRPCCSVDSAAMWAESEARFEAVVMAAPIVDNANDQLWGPNGQYDGPRCAGEDCITPVDNDGELCDECGDQPHEFRPIADTRWPDWCACGRIHAASEHDATDYDGRDDR